MRYALLDFVICPVCSGDLTCLVREESVARMPDGLFPPGQRVSPGPGVGPVPRWRRETAMTRLLSQHAATKAPASRGLEHVVESGLLVCAECTRWFPVSGHIPELLPDHLRDVARETCLFEAAAADLPRDLRDALAAFRPSGDASSDPGAHYKHSEIGIKGKVDDEGFFGPGYSSPFNPWNSEFTLYLIKLFGTVAPILDLKRGETLLDSGCGYAWTTEWLFRSGINAIGVDICRTYVEIGLQRIGPVGPHVVVGDVENLPLRSESFDAVLAYESFHHIPDRPAAMRGYARILKTGGRVVLAEPGAAHEHAQVSVDAMARFGILEKGMELDDVTQYAAGTTFGMPEQIYVVRSDTGQFGQTFDAPFARTNSVFEGNIFRLVKRDTTLGEVRRTAFSPKRWLWPKIKRRIKAALIRIGLD